MGCETKSNFFVSITAVVSQMERNTEKLHCLASSTVTAATRRGHGTTSPSSSKAETRKSLCPLQRQRIERVSVGSDFVGRGDEAVPLVATRHIVGFQTSCLFLSRAKLGPGIGRGYTVRAGVSFFLGKNPR
jgi:hypothetical protein